MKSIGVTLQHTYLVRHPAKLSNILAQIDISQTYFGSQGQVV